MKNYAVYSDCHCHSPIKTYKSFDSMYRFMIHDHELGYKVKSIGDNIDLANVKKRKVTEARRDRVKLVDDNRIEHTDGNHERVTIRNQVDIDSRICFAHGDYEFWGEKRAKKYRKKKQGAGWFKRKIIIKLIEMYEDKITSRVSDDFLKRAAKIAKVNACHTYVCGHKHPPELIDTIYRGIRIIVVPRGRTLLSL